MALPNVGIGSKGGFNRSIVEYHGLPRAKDGPDERLRQRRCGHGLVRLAHDDCIATRYGFRCDPLLVFL